MVSYMYTVCARGWKDTDIAIVSYTLNIKTMLIPNGSKYLYSTYIGPKVRT